MHAMLYAMLSTCARRSLFTQHAPRMDQVTFSEQVNVDGGQVLHHRLGEVEGQRHGGKSSGSSSSATRLPEVLPVVAMAMWFKVLHGPPAGSSGSSRH